MQDAKFSIALMVLSTSMLVAVTSCWRLVLASSSSEFVMYPWGWRRILDLGGML
jgi:hypothetical protein